jgi:predicted RNA-binding protein associated with RNAse of E/G family
MFPHREPGSVLVLEEHWRGRLWSAIPHRYVGGDATTVITHVPYGTTGTFASSLGLPAASGLTTGAGKLRALATLEYRVLELPATPTSCLYFFRADRCSRVNLSWSADGEFTGWYVNFAVPPVPTPDGIESMDLVLDMFILPDGSWSWKDREDFDRGIAEGVLEPRLRPVFEAESQRVLAEYTTSTGAFDPRWIDWRPPWNLPIALLPESFLPGASTW